MLFSSVNVENYFKIFQIEGRSKAWNGRGNKADARSILDGSKGIVMKEIGKRLHNLKHQVWQTNNREFCFFVGEYCGHNHSKTLLPGSARAR